MCHHKCSGYLKKRNTPSTQQYFQPLLPMDKCILGDKECVNQCQDHKLAPYLFWEDLAMVIYAIVTSRTEYCNVLYAGLCLKALLKLQAVQSTAARLLSWPVHVMSISQQLH